MPDAKVALPKPIPYTGLLDKYDSFEVTPYIGSEFSDLQLTEGHRVLSIGEIPYYDPNSVGIFEALEELQKLEIK